MNEHTVINIGTLERWRKHLRRALDNGQIKEGEAKDKVEMVEQQLAVQVATSEPIAVELVPGCTKKDSVEALNLGNNIDYALPQNWVDDVKEKTGLEPAPHFVWDCGANWCPIPVTETGKLILAVYYHITR